MFVSNVNACTETDRGGFFEEREEKMVYLEAFSA
jgi:hypothetical protein